VPGGRSTLMATVTCPIREDGAREGPDGFMPVKLTGNFPIR
jgi:hypothetical protein